jgi:hypothetical protein
VKYLAPPAGFEPALPPPESQKDDDLASVEIDELQVRPTLSGWSLLAKAVFGSGVANLLPTRHVGIYRTGSFLAERSL